MELETKNKTIKIVLRTRKIVDITHKLKSKNFEEGFFKAVRDCDLDAISKIIYSLAENEEGKNAFETSSEVYDFIDEYKKEQEKSYEDILKSLTDEINSQGFFTKKRKKKELEDTIYNPLSSIDMDSVIKKSAENAMTKIAETQMLES
ncbi:MAG: hypothetical protein KIC76_06435 [Firmicutes bacterium]|nr:hypothetical protein [Bacillota bacterium]